MPATVSFASTPRSFVKMATALVGAVEAAWGTFVTVGSAVADASRPWAEASTFMRVPALEAVVDDLASSVGQPGPTVRYLLVLLLAYPLGLVFACLPRPALKHAFSLVVGVFLTQFVFGVEWIHPVIHSLVAYVLLVLTAPAPVSKALGMLRPVLVFGWMLGYLSVQHLWRMHTDYGGWSLDVTGPTMILTIKVSSLAFNLFDGEPARLAKRAAHVAKEGPAHRDSKKFASFAERAVSGVPSPLAFFGYVFCFTSFFAGPGFDFKEYTVSVEESNLPLAAGGSSKDRRWGSRTVAALRKLVFALVFLGVQVALGPRFNINSAVTSTGAKGELSLAALPFLPRVGAALLCQFVTRSKYYFAWLMSEGSCNLAGFGYVRGSGAGAGEGKAKTPESWDGVSAIDVLGFETAGSPGEAVKYWNIRTQRWLFLYTFLRTPAAFNTFLTNMMSAFWHGALTPEGRPTRNKPGAAVLSLQQPCMPCAGMWLRFLCSVFASIRCPHDIFVCSATIGCRLLPRLLPDLRHRCCRGAGGEDVRCARAAASGGAGQASSCGLRHHLAGRDPLHHELLRPSLRGE